MVARGGDGDVIGHLALERESGALVAERGEAVVLPAYRGQGIGSRLLAQVKAWAREQDLEFLILWPAEESIPFYERAGFAPGEAVEYPVRPYVG